MRRPLFFCPTGSPQPDQFPRNALSGTRTLINTSLVKNRVGDVEKLAFRPNGRNLGDRKCPAIREDPL